LDGTFLIEYTSKIYNKNLEVNMKKIIIVLIILSVSLGVIACSEAKKSVSIGNPEEGMEKEEQVIKDDDFDDDQGALLISDDLREKIDGNRRDSGYELIEDDNKKYIVVYMGEQSSGGYSISIEEIKYEEDSIIVNIIEESPGKDMMVTMALTYPYAVAELDSNEDTTNREVIINTNRK
jgi:hypothetical protein